MSATHGFYSAFTRAFAGKRISTSTLAWLGLVAYLVLVKFVLSLLPPLNVRRIAVEFSWSTIAVYAAIGLVGIWLSERTGFPDALDTRISNRQRLLFPVLIGIGFGVLEIGIDLVTHGTKFIESQSGEASFNVYWPASLFVYTGGVVLVEAIYRLFAIPFFLFLISNVILRGRAQDRVFWVLAVVLSLLEPLTLSGAVLFAKPGTITPGVILTIVLPTMVVTYLLNVAQAISFRRYGFLAAFSMRWGEYLMWHIVYGNFIYPALG
jgi:hypothetical protein